jgi:hypothetical protein
MVGKRKCIDLKIYCNEMYGNERMIYHTVGLTGEIFPNHGVLVKKNHL